MIVNFNVVLFDALHNARTKPINVVFFDTTYERDGSKEFMENQLVMVLSEIRANKPIKAGSSTFLQEEDPELPNAYCMNDGDPINPQMTGGFIQYYGTQKLVNDVVAMSAFRKWFVQVVTDFMISECLSPKTKSPEVPNQYLEKIISNVTI